MPHSRKRYLTDPLQQALKHSPVVGILGQRQTGKTTLVKQIVGESYVSLDDAEQLFPAQNSPKLFLQRETLPFAIDECQLAPELFPAIKQHVQKLPRKGQLILTGSVRFSAKKEIRESLTGRIQLLELHPMTLAEASGSPIPNFIRDLNQGTQKFKESSNKRSKYLSISQSLKYLETGGLPGICFLRDSVARRPRFSSHLDTLLGRDLKLISETNHPVSKLRELLTILATQQGTPLALTELARASRISVPSLKKVLEAFEGLFLIRRILPLGDIKKDAFFLEDQGTATYLSPEGTQYLNLLRLVHSQVFPHLSIHDPGGVITYAYETRNGACIPLVFKSQGKTLGFIPITSEAMDKKALASAQSFLKFSPQATIFILTLGQECIEYSKSIWILPITSVF